MGQAGVLSQGASPAASGLAGERRTGSGGRTVAARSAERIPAKETDRGDAGKPGRSACLVGQFPARKQNKTKQNKMWLKKKKRTGCLFVDASSVCAPNFLLLAALRAPEAQVGRAARDKEPLRESRRKSLPVPQEFPPDLAPRDSGATSSSVCRTRAGFWRRGTMR